MIITGIVQPFAILPSISKSYFTRTQNAPVQLLATWTTSALASLL